MDRAIPETHGTRQPTWPVGPVTLRVALLLLLATLVAGLYLWQASEIAATSRRIEALRQGKMELERENAELLDQISAEGSIPHLQERAGRLGFTPATQVEYLEVTVVPPDQAPDAQSLWALNR
jgi:hypothetical protein